MPEHDDHPRPRCAVCSEVIGVYEPVWIEHSSGSLRRTSLLRLDRAEREGAAAIYHDDCVSP
jgi:hypothetical protein